MKPAASDEATPFYVGYQSHAPHALVAVMRKTVATLTGLAAGVAVLTVWALPVPGDGRFEYGSPRRVSGTIVGDTSAPRLKTGHAEYLLVGLGKHRAPLEICGSPGSEVDLGGTLIARENRLLLEVSEGRITQPRVDSPRPAGISLGQMELVGEVVDSKCYFGVMNPGEGPLHRACAELCLRGGIPATLVVRDRAGRVAHLLLTDATGTELNRTLRGWTGAPVRITGELWSEGDWLAFRPNLATLRWAGR